RLGMIATVASVATIASVAAVASALLGAAHAAGAQPRDTGKPAVALPAPASAAAGEGREVAVTVYHENLGVVKDRRRFSISSGLSELRFADVASLIEPTSVHLRSLGKSPLEILWQDYRFDLVSTDKLLERYVDQAIE